jgi:PRTRC genetic system protein E
MFAELMPLLAGRMVCIMASRIDDATIRIIVLPKLTKEGENPALATPLCFTGTPQELDAEFGQQLVTYVASHVALGNTLAEAIAQMEAAAKAAREETKRKVKPKASAEAEKPVGAPAAPMAPSPAPIPSTKSLFDAVTSATDDSPATAKA